MEVHNSDWQLLKDYVERGSQAAFASLVERHVNFVYSTCLREVHNAALAEDVTQVVFLILARKAPQLRESGALAGWLYRTSRFACKNAMKQERHRQRHEQNLLDELITQDVIVESENPATNADWAHIEDHLHDALAHLTADQRDVIFHRFFEGKSVREVATSLGTTEKTVEGRLGRALDKMRRHFASLGYKVSVIALAALLLENATQAAPSTCVASALQLAGSVSAGGAVATTAAGAATTQIISISHGVLKAMLLSQIKTGIVASLGFCIMAGTTLKIAHYAMAAQQKPKSVTSLHVSSNRKLASRPMLHAMPAKTASLPAKKQASMPLPRIVSPRPRILIAQPILPINPQENPVAPEVRPVTPKIEKASIKVADARPETGEIAVEGTLLSINNGRLVIDVTSYTLPAGKTNAVNPPKPKAILLSSQTVIHMRGAATSVETAALKPGALVRIVGMDKGTGEALPARDIAVWDSLKDGVYGWTGAQVTVTPIGAPPNVVDNPIAGATGAVTDPADVPPDDNEEYERPNLFPQGDFQQAVVGQPPPGWTANPLARSRVMEKDGKSWLSIKSAQKGLGTILVNIPVQADWKRVRVAAQLKAKNLQRGELWWHTARLDFNFCDDKNRIVGRGRGLNLWESGDWTKQSRTVEVPEGATHMVLQAGLYFSTGELLLDNIRVEANAPVESRPIRPDFPEGTFEKIEGSGWPEGFEPWQPDTFKVLEENGNHFVRFICKTPGESTSLDSRFTLPPEWKRVRVKARVRLKNYIPGDNPWNNARIGIAGENEWGKQTGDFWKTAQITPSDEWKTVESVNAIDEGVKILRLQPQINGATGIFDVDDIQVMDASNEELPSLPILPNLPGGTFEDLDDNGWPVGWEKEAGKPEVLQVVEELEPTGRRNHYVRLNSNEVVFAAARGRFTLPPDWRALKLKARLRMKNLMQKPNPPTWETARLGFMYQNAQGARTGGYPPSLEMHADSEWKQLELKSDIPLDAVYIELGIYFNNAGGIFDVDDVQLEAAKPDIVLSPIYEWTRAFPEGDFEHTDEQGNPLNWPADGKGRVLEEEGNHFLRLSNLSLQSSVSMASQWKLKPQWKTVRVRARMRARTLKFTGNPLDGARMQVLFLNAQDAVIQPVPAPLEMKKDSDWLDLQTQVQIPPGAVTIRLLPSLSRTSGTLDVDDILIEPGE